MGSRGTHMDNRKRIDDSYRVLCEATENYNRYAELMESVIQSIVVDGLYHGEWFIHHGTLIVKPKGKGKRLLGVLAMPELPVSGIIIMVHGTLLGFAASVNSEEVHIDKLAVIDEVFIQDLINDHKGE